MPSNHIVHHLSICHGIRRIFLSTHCYQHTTSIFNSVTHYTSNDFRQVISQPSSKRSITSVAWRASLDKQIWKSSPKQFSSSLSVEGESIGVLPAEKSESLLVNFTLRQFKISFCLSPPHQPLATFHFTFPHTPLRNLIYFHPHLNTK